MLRSSVGLTLTGDFALCLDEMTSKSFSATFRRIVRNGSTEDFRWLPYVTTLLSTSLWTFYGLLKPGGLLVVTVNGAGAALEAAYVTLYLIYAPRETKVRFIIRPYFTLRLGH